jgi:hypothetical protein
VRGYPELTERFAGCTFDRGLYRVLDAASGPKATELARAVYPGGAQRVYPFAMDWLGRMFALDAARVVIGEPQIMLLEIGTGDALAEEGRLWRDWQACAWVSLTQTTPSGPRSRTDPGGPGRSFLSSEKDLPKPLSTARSLRGFSSYSL